MKARVLTLALMLAATLPAFAQESAPWPKSWSLEITSGLPPLHTSFLPTRADQQALAKMGQEAFHGDSYYPSFNVSAVLRSRKKTEHVFSAGISWCVYPYIQYGAFGTDPQGQPRYDLDKKVSEGWKQTAPSVALVWQWRHLWNPSRTVVIYSGLGAGLVWVNQLIPLPSGTPIGVRTGGKKHFYVQAELTIGPLNTFVQGGLGWRF